VVDKIEDCYHVNLQQSEFKITMSFRLVSLTECYQVKEVTSIGSSDFQHFEFDRSKNINERVKRERKKEHGFVNIAEDTPMSVGPCHHGMALPQVAVRSGNSCYHSVQNLLSIRLLSKNLKTKIYRTIILRLVLYGCKT